MSRDVKAQYNRIDEILNNTIEQDWSSMMQRYFEYLNKTLVFPIEVSGREDFKWEEFYVFGGGDPVDYKKLKKVQPSYNDTYLLTKIKKNVFSKWMLNPFDDIVAHAKRKNDQKEFELGLSELEAVNRKSTEFQLLDDYAVFFCNYR